MRVDTLDPVETPWRQLCDVLHPDGFRDLRAFYADRRDPDEKPKVFGFAASNFAGAADFIQTYGDRDVYMGVATRVDGRSRGADGCAQLWTLFTDIDFKDSSEELARQKLAAFPLPPSCIVRSGGGLQVYWFLRAALNFPTDGPLARALLVALAKATGGDLKATDPARILRVPGTINYKYEPPRDVELELLDPSIRYTVDDVRAVLPPLKIEPPAEPSEPVAHGLPLAVRKRLARRYVDQQPGAIAFQGGDDHTYAVAVAVAVGHDLSIDDTIEVMTPWNTTECKPSWSAGELRRIVTSAAKDKDGKEPRGGRLRLILSAGDPMPAARALVDRKYIVDDVLSLRHQAKVFYAYHEELGCYLERDEPVVRADLYAFLDSAKTWTNEDPPKLVRLKPTKSKVENVEDALKAVCSLPVLTQPPCWLAMESQFRPIDMLPFPNGLLHIPTRTFHPKTPHFYTLNGLDFNYDPYAPSPVEWLKFLDTLWDHDPESIACLREIFGYLLTGDTKLQKILMLIGDKRSGKGTIARILKCLVGERNVCHPTLAAFGTPFGKQALIGKTLAIVSDARIGARTDGAAVAEALLSISGEDGQSVARKFLGDWHGKLSTRFLMLSNELPRINDVSGALASRFILLHLPRTFWGKEDLGLFDRLVTELPSILKWALDGRDRLTKRGHLVQPKSANALMEDFNALGSPESAFLKECTERKQAATVAQKELFAAWQQWCIANGRDKPGTIQMFARNVRAAMPWATTRYVGERGEQERHWEGVKLIHEPAKRPPM